MVSAISQNEKKMTDTSATNESKSAAQAALRAPFGRAAADLAAWGEKVGRGFPHAAVEFVPDAGSSKNTSRAALRIMFTDAVIGKTAKHADYAGLWVVAEHNARHGDVTYEVRPYRGENDKFGTSNRSNQLPRWLGFAETFWSLNNLPLVDEYEGFRQERYHSRTGALPKELPNDLNRLYYYGYDKKIFEDPVAVLAGRPLSPDMMPE